MDVSNVKKYVVYNYINNDVAQMYSLFKLGDISIIEMLSKKLAKEINKLYKDNFVIHAATKFPINDLCKKNSYILAENVAKILDVPFLAGDYKYKYSKNKFYDSLTHRKESILPIKLHDEKIKMKDYGVVMIDDSIVSGNSLQSSVVELLNLTDSISFFSIIKLDSKTPTESEINNYALKDSNEILSKIIMQKDYMFTSHMLRTIDNLQKYEKEKLLENINKDQKTLLLNAFKMYFERELTL